MTTTPPAAPLPLVAPPDGRWRRVPLLREDRLGHYPEFREALGRLLPLDAASPHYLLGPAGTVLELTFSARDGERYPSAVEVAAAVAGVEPVDDRDVDRDLWALLRWVVDSVGEPWRLADLDATRALYRLPPTSA